MIHYPAIDPVAFSIGPLEIRWYGLAYVVGIVLGWLVCVGLTQRADFGFRRKALDDFVPWAILGIILGGRLGNALFYHPTYYLDRPWEVFYIWQPGMSFHGGFLGIVLTVFFFCRQRRLPLLSFGDVIAVGTPLGLLFGRLANFINGELYGRFTDVPWAMVFPLAGPFPRHPSQLYEAALEGLLLFALLLGVARTPQAPRRPGLLVSLFLIGYGVARSIAEFFREPDGIVRVLGVDLTLGQIYSFPLILVGAFLLWHTLRRPLAPLPQPRKS